MRLEDLLDVVLHQAFHLVDLLVHGGNLVQAGRVVVAFDEVLQRGSPSPAELTRLGLAERLVCFRGPDLLNELVQQALRQALGVPLAADGHRHHAHGLLVGQHIDGSTVLVEFVAHGHLVSPTRIRGQLGCLLQQLAEGGLEPLQLLRRRRLVSVLCQHGLIARAGNRQEGDRVGTRISNGVCSLGHGASQRRAAARPRRAHGTRHAPRA
mmetsp:Transcript_50499/g.153616  ORF Transcript_50499/g.153616 Transcript_50499/m.153616 type:complete len:210 (+) Transcript_50499:257-886(+)